MDDATYTAFLDERHLITGPLPDLLRALKTHDPHPGTPLLIFDDRTGRQVDFDLRGTLDEVLARHDPTPPRKGPGRPKLGVTAREVTLLPRHWAWLDEQRGGASATLRRLVDEARRTNASQPDRARAAEATERFLAATAGNRPHFEDATRALYAGDRARFTALIADYPPDIRAHALHLAQHAFTLDPA